MSRMVCTEQQLEKKLVEILELIVDICFSQCNLETCEKFENTKREINRIHISQRDRLCHRKEIKQTTKLERQAMSQKRDGKK